MSYYCLFQEEQRFIFCVDPKCGCTTIKKWFLSTLENRPIEDMRAIRTWMRSPKSVQTADDYIKLWFLRDPLRRLVSFYYQMVVSDQEGDTWAFADHNKVELLKGRTFEDFIYILGDLHKRGERLQHHLEPQTRFLLGVSFDAIVKIEDFNERTDELMALIGVDVRPKHLNHQKSSGRIQAGAYRLKPDHLAKQPNYEYESFWNDELKEIARHIYAEDCRFYESL